MSRLAEETDLVKEMVKIAVQRPESTWGNVFWMAMRRRPELNYTGPEMKQDCIAWARERYESCISCSRERTGSWNETH